MSVVKCLEKIAPSLEERMRADLIRYEASHGIDVNYKMYYFVLEDENHHEIGMLVAYTAFAEVYIEDIWVDSKYRGKGYGRQLIKALETHFSKKGFNNINLVTSEFQAPTFYEKCGFSLEFVRKNNKNHQLTKYFFIKYFNDEIQNQGILS